MIIKFDENTIFNDCVKTISYIYKQQFHVNPEKYFKDISDAVFALIIGNHNKKMESAHFYENTLYSLQ